MVIFHTFGAANFLKIHLNQVDMKKVILGVAIAGLAMSCQKIQPGGNKAILQMEEGTEHYGYDMVTNTPSTAVKSTKTTAELPAGDSLRTATIGAVEISKDSTQQATPAEPAATQTK